MERPVVKNQMYSLIAEMLLEKAVHDFKKQILYKEIDRALDKRDKKRFNYLCRKWKELMDQEKKLLAG